MKRIFTTVAMSIAMALASATPALAATGVWSWRDLTGMLTEQTNRPVWAVAHDNDGWFYTDGQDLWNGGQAYRYDGSTQINITNDLRNAGINRVDDIVSDNSGTVIFLQDVVRLDDNLRAVAYRNGSYTNLTTTLRGVLASDEGLNTITGRNGNWYLITTKFRVLSWSANTDRPVQLSIPSEVSQSGWISTMNADPNLAPYKAVSPLEIVPFTGDTFIVSFRGAEGNVWRYKLTGNSFTSLFIQNAGRVTVNNTNLSENDALEMFGVTHYGFPTLYPGGSAILMLRFDGRYAYRDSTYQAAIYDGQRITKLPQTILLTSVKFSGRSAYSNIITAWNGSAWMVYYNDRTPSIFYTDSNPGAYTPSRLIYRVDTSGITSLGEPRDYFVSVASDGNGNILLGGAVSTLGNSQPTNPLTAKLVMVVEDGGISDSVSGSGTNDLTTGGTFGGDRVYTSAMGPRVTIQGNPSGFRIGNGKEFAYRVTASDPSGVDRIDLYVNDARIMTCKSSVCEYRTTYYLKGETTRTIKFWVRATDVNGDSTDTSGSPDYLTVDANSTASADSSSRSTSQTNSSSGISSWDWLSPNVSSFNAGDSATYSVGAQSGVGINRFQILVNGNVRRTCNYTGATNNVQCDATLYANDYSANTSIFVNANIIDANGNVAWSTGKTIYRNGTGSSNGSNNGTTNVWDSLSPDTSSFSSGDSTTYTANAQDNDGINQVQIYANGNVRQTCNFGAATGNVQCQAGIYANDYSANANVFVNARITDANGNTTWTSGRTIYRNGGSSNNNGSSNTVTTWWTWLDPNQTTLSQNGSVAYHVGAQDGNGIDHIDVYANGNVVRTCSLGNTTASTECSTTLSGSNYSANPDISMNARITDANGNIAWTDNRTIHRDTTTSGSNSSGSNNSVSAWDWLDPNVSSIASNGQTTYHVGGWASAGLSAITVYVNGNTLPDCTYNTTYGNVECQKTISASNYTQGTEIFVNARVRDVNGREAWTTGRRFAISSSSGSSNSGSSSRSANATVNVWSDHDNGYNSSDTVTLNANASDPEGVSRIELYMNDSLIGTCYATTCSASASRFSSASSNQYHAVVFDTRGDATSSAYRTIRHF